MAADALRSSVSSSVPQPLRTLSDAIHARVLDGSARGRARLNKARSLTLATDIWLVALGLRTAHLIDAFSPTLHDSHALVDVLIQLDGLLGTLMILREHASAQVFVVNRDVLRARLQHELRVEDEARSEVASVKISNNNDEPVWSTPLYVDVRVEISRGPQKLESRPYFFSQILEVLWKDVASPSEGPYLAVLKDARHGLAGPDLMGVTLAGWLLEYEAIYTLAVDESSSITGSSQNTPDPTTNTPQGAHIERISPRGHFGGPRLRQPRRSPKVLDEADAFEDVSTPNNLSNIELVLYRCALCHSREGKENRHELCAFSIPSQILEEAGKEDTRYQREALGQSFEKRIRGRIAQAIRALVAQNETEDHLRRWLSEVKPIVKVTNVSLPQVAL